MVMSDAICEFIFICCSTPANCTSCWVNWLVSSGSSGFWFFSCVVSSVRNVVKFDASDAASVALFVVTPEVVLGLVPVAEVTGLGMIASYVGHGLCPYTLMSTPPPSPIIRP